MNMILARILICTGLALVSMGCAPAENGPAPIQEAVTLTFIVPSEYSNLYKPAVDAFKEVEPNISIEIKSFGFSQQDSDVALVRWFDQNQDDDERVEALDLTPFLQQDGDFNPEDYLPGALETFRETDKQYALPTGIDPFVIFYNQDLFDRLGVPYPQPVWTLDDFRTTALQITAPSEGVYGYVPSDFYIDCLFFTYQFGGQLIDAEQNVRLDSPETIQALEWYASLYGTGGVAPNQDELEEAYDMGGRAVGIVTGKVGMWLGSVTNLSTELGGMIRFKVGMAPLPSAGEAFSPANFEGLMISANTANPQAAWRWVKFLAARPNSWVYPARISLAESEEFLTLFGRDQAAGAKAAVANATRLSGFDFGRFRQVMFQYFSAVRSVVEGGVPADEALRSAQENVTQP
jgi:multiple sugar transport system substrate-binding protein